jgi:hypothetical protein
MVCSQDRRCGCSFILEFNIHRCWVHANTKQTELAQVFPDFLVVTALPTVLRGQPGRNPVDNDDTGKLSGGMIID